MVIIAFKTLSEQEFNSISNSFSPIISGHGQGDINVFRRYKPKFSRDQGLLSILSQIGKRALPFLKEWVLPSAKEYGKNVLTDVISGKTLKSSLKSRGKESLQNIGKKIMGSGSRKRRASALKRKKLKRLRRTTHKGKGRKNKNNRKRIKKSYGGLRKKRKSHVRKNRKIKKISRPRRTLMRKKSCARKKNPSCPKDIFS